ncbi:MAG: hypothetical protein QXR69_01835 [Conexivisphaerales archaeon]
MSIDILSLAIGAAVGAGLAVAVSFILVRKTYRSGKTQNKTVQTEGKLVMKSEIEAAKRDLKLLRMEKEYLSSALARIYEAESKGLINREERILLSQKYRNQMKDVEEKLAKASVIVEVSDLEDVKSELLNLFNQKMSQIDARLEQLKERIQPFVPALEKTVEQVEQAKEKKEVVEEKKPRVVDDKLKKVVEDVNEVMAKLEQLDLEE